MCIYDIGTIAGLIGAAAWLAPWVYKKFTKPELKGRLISHFENQGVFNQKQCIMHFLALNIISIHRCFNIEDTEIKVKYKGTSQIYNGKLFWARTNEWHGPIGERLKLEILPEDTLPFVGTIPQDLTKKIYITFYTDKGFLDIFEKISITFIEQSGRKNTITIDHDLIDGDQTLWDDRIWKVV